jgi:hypothetical protein
MKIIKTENPLPVDVDDTLILYTAPEGQEEDYIYVIDPYEEEEVKVKVWPHKPHIKILKDKKSRRSKIIVWSQSGYEWAAAVIEALGLEDYIDYVMCKPKEYMDDLDSSAWMGSRIYLPPESKFKSETLDKNKK